MVCCSTLASNLHGDGEEKGFECQNSSENGIAMINFPTPNEPDDRASSNLNGDSDMFFFKLESKREAIGCWLRSAWMMEYLPFFLFIPLRNRETLLVNPVQGIVQEHHHIPGITTSVRLLEDASNIAPRNANLSRHALKQRLNTPSWSPFP